MRARAVQRERIRHRVLGPFPSQLRAALEAVPTALQVGRQTVVPFAVGVLAARIRAIAIRRAIVVERIAVLAVGRLLEVLRIGGVAPRIRAVGAVGALPGIARGRPGVLPVQARLALVGLPVRLQAAFAGGVGAPRPFAQEGDRASVESIRRLIVNPGSTRPVTLDAVAEVVATNGPSEIHRADQTRVAVVSANLRDIDLGGAVREVVRVEGPERIAPEWWRERSTARLRDYYRIEDDGGRRYWIYRQGITGDGRGGVPDWFLQGLYA